MFVLVSAVQQRETPSHHPPSSHPSKVVRVLSWAPCSIQLLPTCCSVTKLCPILCNPMGCSTTGFPVLHHLSLFTQLKSIELVMLPMHLILCCPLLLLPSIFPSTKVFSSAILIFSFEHNKLFGQTEAWQSQQPSYQSIQRGLASPAAPDTN